MTCHSCGEEQLDYYVVVDLDHNELVERRLCELCFTLEYQLRPVGRC
jgi:hypothetical protein